MRVLVAGATGAIGRQLVPLLQDLDHEVTAIARSSARSDVIDAEVVEVDALDAAALSEVIRRADPEVIVDMLTAIPQQLEPRHFARQFAATNRLRIEGTANLVAAAPRARLITQGVAFAYKPRHGGLANEDRPLWVDGPKPFRPAVQALITAERVTREAGGVTLRFGHLYGPGTAYADDGAFVSALRAGRAAIVGSGGSVFSFVHTFDAATAVVAAVESRVTGAFNIVDDDPAPVREWLPALARVTGSRAPRRVPTAIARLVVGSWGVAFMTELVGADNRLGRRALDWRPAHPSWREGFAAELAPGETSDGRALRSHTAEVAPDADGRPRRTSTP